MTGIVPNRRVVSHLLIAAALSSLLFGEGCIPRWRYRRSSAILKINKPPPTQLVGLFAEKDDEAMRTSLLELVRARPVLANAVAFGELGQLQMLKKKKDPVAWLQGAIEVKTLDNSGLFEVAVVGKLPPNELQAIVSGVVEAYLKVINDARHARLKDHLKLHCQEYAANVVSLKESPVTS